MNEWKARLPRGLPAEGRTKFLVGLRSSRGARFEWCGETSEPRGLMIWQLVNMSDEDFAEKYPEKREEVNTLLSANV